MQTSPAGPSEGPSSPPQGGPTGSAVEVPPARWRAIVDDLAGRGVTGEPTAVSVRSVTWNDGALGCPEPGVAYTQAMVDGLQVIVEVAGRRYDYRFGRSDTPRLCEHPGPVSSSSDR